MMRVACLIAVERCPPVPTPAYSDSDTMHTDQGTEVMLSCDLGYGFPHGPTYQTITCSADLTWTNVPADCQRKSTFSFSSLSCDLLIV